MTGLKKRTLLIVSAILITFFIVSVAVLSARWQTPKNKQLKEWLSSIPQSGTKVKNLEIINLKVVRQDTEIPGVVFEVWNRSNRAVMALEISCGNGSIAKDGLEDEENPTVVIEPYGTLPVEMSGELDPGNPIVVTAAIFNDNKEEGQKSSLELMHKIRARQQATHKLVDGRGMFI
jgi:hypothetical protein